MCVVCGSMCGVYLPMNHWLLVVCGLRLIMSCVLCVDWCVVCGMCVVVRCLFPSYVDVCCVLYVCCWLFVVVLCVVCCLLFVV